MPKPVVAILVIVLAIGLYRSPLFSTASIKEKQTAAPSTNDYASIRSLPYGSVSMVPASEEDKNGVVLYNQEKAFSGYNLASYRDRTGTELTDMDGNVLHTWRFPLENTAEWQHVSLCANGDLLVMAKGTYIARLDWNSNLRWIIYDRFHHEIISDSDGLIYGLSNTEHLVTNDNGTFPVLDDLIVVITPDGKVIEKTPIFPIFGDRVPPLLLKRIEQWAKNKAKEDGISDITELRVNPDSKGDVFHTNSVFPLPRNIDGLAKKGDLLISIRQLNTVAIVDRKSKAIIWHWGPEELQRQHHATLLDNGDVLIFDNGKRSRRTRAVQVNPIRNQIVWQYGEEQSQRVFSHWGGSAQRLKNGNTLIAVTDKGRAIEVTAAGEIVWDYYTESYPIEPGETKRRKRPTLFRIQRLTKDYLKTITQTLSPGQRTALNL